MKKFIVALALVCAVGQSASWKSEGPYFGTIKDIAVDPSNPETVYAASHGGGVWKSSDGGASWKLSGKELASKVIVWIEIDPKNPKKLFAGVDDEGVARSNDGGETWKFLSLSTANTPQTLTFVPGKSGAIWLADVNLHDRSADGGATWTDFRVPESDVRVFRFHPTNSKIVWAGGTDGKTGLSKSVDGGATWKKIGKGLKESNSVQDLIVDPSNADVLYMKTRRGGYKSTDGGESWTMLGGEVEDKEIEAIAIDPSSPETIYIATDEALFKSDDGGEGWSDIDYGLPAFVVQTITVHPSDSNRLWVGAGATGVYRSIDGGRKWMASNEGLAAAWIDQVWGDSTGIIFAQARLGLFRKDPGGGWTEIRKPFSKNDKAQIHRVLFDKKAPRVIHVGDGSSYFRSVDGGKTWTESSKFFLEPTPTLNTLVIDVDNPRIQYGTGSTSDGPLTAIMKSTDGGAKWKGSGKGLVTKGVKLLRSESGGKLIAVTSEHEVWTSSDAAGTWSKSSGLPGKAILNLVIDPANPARVFAITEEAVFRSEDGGVSWTGLEKAPKKDVTSVAIAGDVFVGTRHGVFRSTDNGATWTKFNDGLLNADVMALSGAGKRLYVGIAGAGVFSIDLE